MATGNMLELAYLAGIIDGEGCISVSVGKRDERRPNAYVKPSVAVAMTDPEAVQLFADHVGTTVRTRVLPSGRVLFKAQVSGVEATRRFLEDILPYLRVKNEQARVVVGLCANSQSRVGKYLSRDQLDYRDAAIANLHSLKKVGT